MLCSPVPTTQGLAVPSVWKMPFPPPSSLSARPSELGSYLPQLTLMELESLLPPLTLPLCVIARVTLVYNGLSPPLCISSLAQYLDPPSRPFYTIEAEKTPILFTTAMPGVWQRACPVVDVQRIFIDSMNSGCF